MPDVLQPRATPTAAPPVPAGPTAMITHSLPLRPVVPTITAAPMPRRPHASTRRPAPRGPAARSSTRGPTSSVTHIWQTWNNCGPATLAMYLSYFGQKESRKRWRVAQARPGRQERRPGGDGRVCPEPRPVGHRPGECRCAAAAAADPRGRTGADRNMASGATQRRHGPLSLADRL